MTFLAFVIAGWTPLLPYVLDLWPLFELSIGATAVAFFAVGASRTVVTRQGWLYSGTEMLAVGMVAAGVAYGAGAALAGVA